MSGRARQGHTARSGRPGLLDEDKRYDKVYDARIMRRLWPFVVPYTAGLALAVVCMIGGALSHLAAPYVVKLALDGARCNHMEFPRPSVEDVALPAVSLSVHAENIDMRSTNRRS